MTGPSGDVAAVLRCGLLGGLVLPAAHGLSDVLPLVCAAVLIACVGPLGPVLATPLAAAGTVFVRVACVGDVLGDRAGEGN